MAYTPSKTWASGNTLLASDLMNNLDGMKEYSHSITSAGDLRAAQWVDTKHIMPGTIDAQTSITSNASGMYGGQQHSWQSLNYTFLTRWNSSRTSATARNLIIPQTYFTLQLGRPATVYYQWWLQAQTRRDGYDMHEMSYFFATDRPENWAPSGGVHKMVSQNVTRTMAGLASGNAGVNITGTRSFSGFEVVDPTAVSQFAIGLRGRSDVGQCAIFSWGVSIELFYL